MSTTHRFAWRTSIVLALIGAALAVALLLQGSTPATANNAAVVIKDGGCGLLDGDGGFASASSDQAVITSSGNAILKCSVKGVANSTGQAVHYDSDNNPLGPGIPCSSAAGGTIDWKEVVSAAGNATLTCKFH
jgi:hypothetical protein